MGLAISGMHYTGMMAVTFDPTGICISGPLTVGQQYLVPVVGFGTVLLLLSAILITHYGVRTKAPQVESELQLAAGLFDTMAEGVMITDSEHHILSVNAFFSKITGYMAEEVVGEPCSRIFPDIGKPDILSAMSSANDSNRCWRGELVGHHKTGRFFPAQLSMSAINNKLAQQPSHLVIFTDITEYKEAIEALQYSENFSRATIDALAANICVLDEKSNIIAVNQAWRNFSRTNCSGADEIGVGHNYLSACESASGPYSEDALLMGAGLRAVLEGASAGYRLEYPCHSGPERRWFVARVTPFADNSRRVVITHQDITERKLAEIALRDSEERWKFALEGASEGVWDWNMQTNEVMFSKRWKEMLGYEENEIENKFEEWEKRVHPDDLPRVMAEVDRYVRGQSPDFSSEHRMRCKDGRWKWILSRGRVVSYDSKQNPLRMIGTHADITDRKEAEVRQVRAVVDASPAATLLIDANGVIEYANKVASHIFGYQAMQLSGLDINTLVPLGAYVANISADQLHVSKANLELCGNHKTGRKIPLEASLSLVQMAGQSVVIASLVDISGRKQAELERLRDIERQRDTLVREVHHRVKNNLQGMIGMLDLQANKEPGLAPLIEDISAKIMSLAIVFGLLGKTEQNHLKLCEITSEICSFASQMSSVVIKHALDCNQPHAVLLEKEMAVPIALIVNELITNAIKHGVNENGSQKVSVAIGIEEQTALLTVRNACKAEPADLNFDLGEGLGTGLSLVRSMLPRKGASLSLRFNDGEMIASLMLTAPVAINWSN
jgi:PAS domain S-box-containing protein